MSRISVVTNEAANPEQAALFKAITGKIGMVPNFLRILANSPVALEAFLGLHKIANEGVLDRQTRERIALTVAQENGCQYCVSAHTAIGRKAGLDHTEITANRTGTSLDARAAAAVSFAHGIVAHKGQVSASELLALRNAGYGDAEIVEIITHVGMNVLTNLIGTISQVEIDFPTVELKLAT
jgi:uncharacterized peroxidase-related enzyme